MPGQSAFAAQWHWPGLAKEVEEICSTIMIQNVNEVEVPKSEICDAINSTMQKRQEI